MQLRAHNLCILMASAVGINNIPIGTRAPVLQRYIKIERKRGRAKERDMRPVSSHASATVLNCLTTRLLLRHSVNHFHVHVHASATRG